MGSENEEEEGRLVFFGKIAKFEVFFSKKNCVEKVGIFFKNLKNSILHSIRITCVKNSIYTNNLVLYIVYENSKAEFKQI